MSGRQFDEFGLPSLTSRMTSDSYNVQNFARAFQTICVRAPIMLIGGITVTMIMDPVLSGILCAIVPFLLVVVVTVSQKGIPLYQTVQTKLDGVVRIMRENIMGIRVIKALSKTEYEKKRFHGANDEMMKSDIKASTFMAIPGPFMQFCLNCGLTIVILVGAGRVNRGVMQPGVILAFLTYFNMIMQSVMAINRVFMMISKASASAERIDSVLQTVDDQPVLDDVAVPQPKSRAFISFENVSFGYHKATGTGTEKQPDLCLCDISFELKRGESLGIIGPTGCGKTTVINLLMRFYDADRGNVFVDGRDVRTYPKDELHKKFGVVFQNDVVFNDSLKNNIVFGRDVKDEKIRRAIENSMAAEFIDKLDDGLEYIADIKGANLSGGQKQRLLISHALADNPEILILDDSSSALDYKTDAHLRRAVGDNYGASTVIMVAQRVSSIIGMTNIMVMEDGKIIGYGKHEELLKCCSAYRETCEAQMGAMFE